MIGVITTPDQAAVVAEFFELFKTPWELYRQGCVYDVVISTTDVAPQPMPSLFISCGADAKAGDLRVGVPRRRRAHGMVVQNHRRVPIYAGLLTFTPAERGLACAVADDGDAAVVRHGGRSVTVRVGYDMFAETRVLLSAGQPIEHASIPALDVHIDMLRQWMLDAGIPIVEVPPVPAGHDFAVCLTHDIDFVGIRRHRFDHTMWGFLYRSTVGALADVATRRISVTRLWKMWRAAASLPFVYLGWARDFWEPFEWYLETERGLPATYYLIPFKRRAGERVDASAAARRGCGYDVSDIQESVTRLVDSGCEVGVHGIDAWHDVGKAREELARIGAATGQPACGTRIHWLLQDGNTPAVLEQAGYAYDSTAGYNETVGYRNGTSQVFRPLAVQQLLELPMHLQDGALFYPTRLNLTDHEAEVRCERLIEHARESGGVLTVLWHDRSHGPERFWGDFYRKLVLTLKSCNAWFGTGAEVVRWFGQRRGVHFVRVDGTDSSRLELRCDGREIHPPLRVRTTCPSAVAIGSAGRVTDAAWNGLVPMRIDATAVAHAMASLPAAASR